MEIPGGDTSATAMQERGPNLHRYNHDFYLAVTLQSLSRQSLAAGCAAPAFCHYTLLSDPAAPLLLIFTLILSHFVQCDH